jgi:hypothetical protein
MRDAHIKALAGNSGRIVNATGALTLIALSISGLAARRRASAFPGRKRYALTFHRIIRSVPSGAFSEWRGALPAPVSYFQRPLCGFLEERMSRLRVDVRAPYWFGVRVSDKSRLGRRRPWLGACRGYRRDAVVETFDQRRQLP